MTKVVVAVVVALTLAGSAPSFAASQMSQTKNGVRWHHHAVHGVHPGSTIYPSGRDPYKGENRSGAPLGETWPGNGAT
jgi:hypothetical protein